MSSSGGVAAKDFDGIWSVNIVAESDSCPTQTIPIAVSNGMISFSGFGSEAIGKVDSTGAIRLKISLAEQEVQINGKARGGVASGSWRTAPDGCEGSWTAKIAG
jgi:hypothetical protein